ICHGENTASILRTRFRDVFTLTPVAPAQPHRHRTACVGGCYSPTLKRLAPEPLCDVGVSNCALPDPTQPRPLRALNPSPSTLLTYRASIRHSNRATIRNQPGALMPNSRGLTQAYQIRDGAATEALALLADPRSKDPKERYQ